METPRLPPTRFGGGGGSVRRRGGAVVHAGEELVAGEGQRHSRRATPHPHHRQIRGAGPQHAEIDVCRPAAPTTHT
jgi:hypothetical protein